MVTVDLVEAPHARPRPRLLSYLRRNVPLTVALGIFWLAAMVFVAAFADQIRPFGITAMDLSSRLAPPGDLKAKEKEEHGKRPPPFPMGGPQGLWADDGALYVLAGPMIYQYSTPDLTLKTKVKLPKPEFPKAGH